MPGAPQLMLIEDTLIWDYLTYLVGAAGVGMIIFGLLWRNSLLIILGIVLPGGMLALSASQKITLKFEVVIVDQSGGTMAWRKVKQFVGGDYSFRDGRDVRISKPKGGPIGTVVINDSNQKLQIIRVIYTANPQIPGPSGRDIVAVIDPGKTGNSLKRVEHFGPMSEGPPGTIKSLSSFDTLDWLAW